MEEAQVAVDAWVAEYNTDRPHQALDAKAPVTPAERFAPIPGEQRQVLPLWLPPVLEAVAVTDRSEEQDESAGVARESAIPALPSRVRQPKDALEVERAVGASGNLSIRRQQFWLGPARVGQRVRFWIDCDMIHLSVGGTRVKTVRSHLSVTDLAILSAQGAASAGPRRCRPRSN